MTYPPISELTLLDWYAAQAMQGLLARLGNASGIPAVAVEVAEEMLKEREKRLSE